MTGNSKFLADLHMDVPDAEMRRRYAAGEYGKMRPEFVQGWRRLAGRNPK